jgi:beta-N-acetylhexosaminidase
MSLASRIILAAVEGQDLSADERSFFAHSPPAGFTLFGRNIPSDYPKVNRLNQSLQDLCAETGLPLLIAIDQEGGRVARLRGEFPNLGPARSLAGGGVAAEDLELIRNYALNLSQALLALGINCNFAPVCDILTEPSNTAIGDRVFGDTADAVIVRAGAFLDGAGAAGIMSCLKHFPGQGDARVDTHLEFCQIDLDDQVLTKRELAPFIALHSKADMVMLSHCVYPAWDHRPASLSQVVINEILRHRVGFQGLVVSDDMVMHAIPQDDDAWAASIVEAILAGVDLVLVCRHLAKVELAVTAIDREARRSSVFAKRLESACVAVDQFRAQKIKTIRKS